MTQVSWRRGGLGCSVLLVLPPEHQSAASRERRAVLISEGLGPVGQRLR